LCRCKRASGYLHHHGLRPCVPRPRNQHRLHPHHRVGGGHDRGPRHLHILRRRLLHHKLGYQRRRLAPHHLHSHRGRDQRHRPHQASSRRARRGQLHRRRLPTGLHPHPDRRRSCCRSHIQRHLRRYGHRLRFRHHRRSGHDLRHKHWVHPRKNSSHQRLRHHHLRRRHSFQPGRSR